MSAHNHTEFVAGCYRCDLSRDETPDHFVTDDERGRILWRGTPDDETPQYVAERAVGTEHLRAAIHDVDPVVFDAAAAVLALEPRRHATGVVNNDRLEVRQLRTELGQARAAIAEIKAALARIDSDAACVPVCVTIGRILNGGVDA